MLNRHAINKIFVSLTLLLSLTCPVMAQDQIFTLDDFSGGLNTKLSEYSLPPKQGTVVKNIRFDESLKAISKRDKTVVYGTVSPSEAITGLHRMYLDNGTKVLLATHGDQIDKGNDTTGAFTKILDLTNADRRSQWLTWRNIAIGTDGYNQPVKYDGSSASATYLGSVLATDAGSGSGPTGTGYKYKVACYTTSYIGNYNQVSNSLTMTGNDITLTMIPVCPDTILGETIIGRKIYRNKTAGSTYYLLSNGTIADNATLTLTDSDADAGLSATVYDTTPDEVYTPPLGKLVLVHKNRLWIANNPTYPSRLYYSEDGSHDTFISDSYLNIRYSDGDEITFIKNVLGLLTVGKTNSIQKVYTDEDNPDDWAISDPFSHVGCHAPYSVVNTPLGLIYLGNNGLYSFNGQYSQLVSDAVTPEIKDIQPSNYGNVWAELYKNSYYMSYASKKSGSSLNNRMLILDTLTNAYDIDTFSANVLLTFRSGSDIEALYSGSSTSGKVYGHTSTISEIVHNKHEDFAGTFDDMRYIPVAVGGDANSPVLELSWDLTIDEMVGTIDTVTGIIDRPDTDGTYTSQPLLINASKYDKLYWNELLPAVGGNTTVALRAGATTPDCVAAAWSSEYDSPTGSDISALTPNIYMQYKISMTSNDITETPTIVKLNNYNVKITYNTVGTTDESTIPLEWSSGWLDLAPGYKKVLKKLYLYYDWPDDTAGTLNVTFTSLDGHTDTFAIDLRQYPSVYTEYFTGGKLLGTLFKFDISETSLNIIKIYKMVVVYEIEPLI